MGQTNQTEPMLTVKCNLESPGELYNDTIDIKYPKDIGEFCINLITELTVGDNIAEFDICIDGNSIYTYNLNTLFDFNMETPVTVKIISDNTHQEMVCNKLITYFKTNYPNLDNDDKLKIMLSCIISLLDHLQHICPTKY